MDPTKRKARNAKRFWAKVIKAGPNDCWEWTGGKDGGGYGMFYVDGRTVHASKFSLELHLNTRLKATKQLKPEDRLALHTCDNTGCVNPVHLYVGSQADNIADRDSRNRTCKGESRYNHKLTDHLVRNIRSRHSVGQSLSYISRKLDLHVSTVWGVVKRKGWKHVT